MIGDFSSEMEEKMGFLDFGNIFFYSLIGNMHGKFSESRNHSGGGDVGYRTPEVSMGQILFWGCFGGCFDPKPLLS
jgi:hypothetical protein